MPRPCEQTTWVERWVMPRWEVWGYPASGRWQDPDWMTALERRCAAAAGPIAELRVGGG